MTEEEHARSLGIDVAPLHQRRLAADLLLRRARPEEKGPEGECKRSHEADIIFRRQCSTPPRSNRDGPPLPSRGVSSYGMSGDAGSPLFPWTNAWTNRTNAPTRAWRNGRRKGLKTPYPVRDVPVRARLPVPGNCPVNGLKILRPQGRAGSTPAARTKENTVGLGECRPPPSCPPRAGCRQVVDSLHFSRIRTAIDLWAIPSLWLNCV